MYPVTLLEYLVEQKLSKVSSISRIKLLIVQNQGLRRISPDMTRKVQDRFPNDRSEVVDIAVVDTDFS